MADYNSSLPVRTEAAGDIDIFISDATTPTNKLQVNADGSINVVGVDFDMRDLVFATDKVDVSGSSVTVTATNLDIRDLTFATDKVDVSGSSVTVTATDLDIRNLAFATDKVDVTGSSVTVSATDLDIRNLAFATDKVDVSGSSVTVTATQLDIDDLDHGTDSVRLGDGTNLTTVTAGGQLNVKDDDLDAATDSVEARLYDSTGAAYTALNPVPVTVTSVTSGDKITDFNTTAAVASSSSVNHDYTVTAAKTFAGEEAWISGSGKIKAEIIVDPAGANTTLFVGFNSTANPNIRIPLEQIPEVTASTVIRIRITNRDNQAQDVYSTLLGLEA